jgi:tetratricopeptide (TPR) repeat protein
MCRRANSLLGSRTLLAALVIGCGCLAVGDVQAQSAEAFPLEPGTRQELVELQELWIDWLTDINQGDLDGAAEIADALLTKVEALGMRGLPELSTAAAVQATAFSAEDDFDKAEAALYAAELLQPGEPETAFARMTTVADQGRWLAAGGWMIRGAVRMLRSSISRPVILANAFHWLLIVLTLGAFSFVGLEMAARGGLLVRDLSGFIERSLPPVAAFALTALLMIWPIFLPAGLLWLALYWSVLLWGYGTARVRFVMIVLWLFLGALPLLVSENVRRLDLSLSVPVRAVERAGAGRLEGSLFSDLGALAELLPESSAVKHLEADLHLQLRQWAMARSLYREVLAAEGNRADILADLGAVYFYEGDLDNSILYLQQAAAVPGAPAEVYFNLSRALSEQYRFTESEAMLRRASSLDSQAVGRWISSMESDWVVRASGGLARQDEIRREIKEVWGRDESDTSLADVWRRTLSIPLALVLVGPAVAVFLLARRTRRRVPREPEPWFSGSLERLRRAALPGLAEAENKRLGRSWLVVIAALALLSLPCSSQFTYSSLLGYSPGLSVAWIISSVGLFVLLVLRFVATGGHHRSKGG